MSTSAQTESTILLAVTPSSTKPVVQVRLEDTLASAQRLWVRGRLSHFPSPSLENRDNSRWWERWRGKSNQQPLPLVQLEMRVSGSVLQTSVPLRADGRFEAQFLSALPTARRGWRVARHHLTCGDVTAETCGLVLEPPRDAAGAVLVLLPLGCTYEAGGLLDLAHWEFASRLTRLLRTLAHGPKGDQPIYYVACVPPDATAGQAEFALALKTLGWPTGNIVLLPAEPEEVKTAFLVGVDRLRWLFAGQVEMLVLNLEPAVVRPLATQLGQAEDRAIVRRLVNPQDDPWQLIEAEKTAALNGNSSLVPAPFLRSPRPTRAGLLPRYPIVFCHGMLAYTMLNIRLSDRWNYFEPLKDFLQQRGFRVLFPQVPPTSGVVERATRLRDLILRWTDEPVNMIAHSMGGLDARYLISTLGMADRVRSLTTVCTPHRGSFMADWFIANFRRRVPLLLALEAMGINVDGFRDCRPSVCREFNIQNPDRPEVRYYSYGGSVHPSRVTPVLRRAWNLLAAAEGPNDGLVSMTSARWGEYLGTIQADHFAQTPDGLFIRHGEDFDSLGFFSKVAEDLARRGF